MSEYLIFCYCCMAPGCEKVYNSKFNLKRHMDCKHWKAKMFVCEACSHEFSSKQNLDEHRFLHSGEKPFVCPHCPMTFRQASQLSLHKRVHTSAARASSLPSFPDATSPSQSSERTKPDTLPPISGWLASKPDFN